MYKTIFKTAEIPVEDFIRNYRDADKFIVFCKQCGQYEKCWACPPYNFDVAEKLSGHRFAYIIGTKIVFDEQFRKNYRTIEGTNIQTKTILAEVRKLLDENLLTMEAQYPESRAFFAGTCFHCPNGKCTRPEGFSCVQHSKLRYSLEAFGFDVDKTASELLGIELKWSNDDFLPEYFTLISGFFTNHKIDKHLKIKGWL